VLENGAIVFGTEVMLEVLGTGFANVKVNANDDEKADYDEKRDICRLGVCEVKGHCDLLCGAVRDGKGLAVKVSRPERDIYALHHQRLGARSLARIARSGFEERC
jgi:hypothetical protein